MKEKLTNILCVDSVDGLLWNYEPKNYKVGDKIICVESCQNHYVGEEVIAGKEYTVATYDKGNLYKKGYLQVEEGRGVKWNDDRFELISENKVEDVECIVLFGESE